MDRSGLIPTTDGLIFHLKTDLGSAKIQTFPPDARREVRYTVHVETDAVGNAGQFLLDAHGITASSNPSGVELTGALPKHTNRAEFWVEYTVSVPLNYNVKNSTALAIF